MEGILVDNACCSCTFLTISVLNLCTSGKLLQSLLLRSGVFTNLRAQSGKKHTEYSRWVKNTWITVESWVLWSAASTVELSLVLLWLVTSQRKMCSCHEHTLLVKGFSIFEIAPCCSQPMQCLFTVATFCQPLQRLSFKKCWQFEQSGQMWTNYVVPSFFLSHTHRCWGNGIRGLVYVYGCCQSVHGRQTYCGCETGEQRYRCLLLLLFHNIYSLLTSANEA